MNIRGEIEVLRNLFDEELRRLPDGLGAKSSEVLRRIRIRESPRGRADSWMEQFAPRAVLYPLLQAEGLQLRRDESLQAAVAHVFLLIYAFMADRIEIRDLSSEATDA